jgi:hypothetical protein
MTSGMQTLARPAPVPSALALADAAWRERLRTRLASIAAASPQAPGSRG